METIEAKGETVQAAIDAGMAELGVESPSQVMVEVLQEPDRGIMGEGAKPAIVRLLYMGTGGSTGTSIVADEQKPKREPILGTQISAYTPPPQEQKKHQPSNYDASREYSDKDDESFFSTEDEVALEDASEDARVGKQVLEELLGKMQVEGRVVIRLAQSTRPNESNHWVLGVVGPKMNRLIGRRGDTLASLQYITRLIVSRRLQRRANIIVDAGDYKHKRSRRLHQLANRMADQAVQQQLTVTLEPMPPHERRVIHLTLRHREDVTTKSVGDGDGRKVTITPVITG